MEYNPDNKSFLCEKCGPGKNKWKHIATSVLVNEETGDCFCVVHLDTVIGKVDLVPEWRDNGSSEA
jgi:hypothetical protein